MVWYYLYIYRLYLSILPLKFFYLDLLGGSGNLLVGRRVFVFDPGLLSF